MFDRKKKATKRGSKKEAPRKPDIIGVLEEVLEEFPMAVGMRAMIIDRVKERI